MPNASAAETDLVNDGDELQQLNVRLPKRTIRLAQRVARTKGVSVATLVNEQLLLGVRDLGDQLKKESEARRAEAELQAQLLVKDLEEALKPVTQE